MMAFDDFERADSTDLGADWAELAGDYNIVGGSLRIASFGSTSRGVARNTTNLGSPDHWAEVVVDALHVSSAYTDIGPAVRVSADGLNFYHLRRIYQSSGRWEVRKVVGGVETVLGAQTVLAPSLPELWRLEVEGSTLRVYLNGAEIGTRTDTDVPAGNHAGVVAYRNATSQTTSVDSFESGVFIEATSVTGADDQTVTVDSPVTLGPFTGTPSGGTWLTAHASGPAPTLTGSMTNSPTYTAPSTPGTTVWDVTYTPTEGDPLTVQLEVTYALPAPPNVTAGALVGVTRVPFTVSGGTVTLTHDGDPASGPAPASITGPTGGEFVVTHPAGFAEQDDPMVLQLDVEDAYGQTDTATVTIFPTGGAPAFTPRFTLHRRTSTGHEPPLP